MEYRFFRISTYVPRYICILMIQNVCIFLGMYALKTFSCLLSIVQKRRAKMLTITGSTCTERYRWRHSVRKGVTNWHMYVLHTYSLSTQTTLHGGMFIENLYVHELVPAIRTWKRLPSQTWGRYFFSKQQVAPMLSYEIVPVHSTSTYWYSMFDN